MAAQPLTNTPGDGRGVSGPAYATAEPRQQPSQRLQGTQDGPKAQDLHKAWEAYHGRLGDGQGNNNEEGPLKSKRGIPNVNVNSNRIRPIVETGVDYLFGPPLTIAVEGPGAPQAQKILDATWGNADKQMTLLSKSGINGGVYGHVFLKVVEPRRGTPSALNPPRLVLLNPELMTVETDPDDADLVVRFCIEYATTDIESGKSIRKRQTITRIDPDQGQDQGQDQDDATTAEGVDTDITWEIQNWVATSTFGTTWVKDGAPRSWPYALPPISDWQNYPNPNSRWGQPDVTESLINLNKQLRLCESNTQKIGFVQGSKIMYSTGADTGNVQPTPGEIIDLGAPDAEIKAVDASGDLQQLMNFADQIRSDMDEESGIPGVALGRMKDFPRGQISGVAMRLLHASALARNEHKQRLYGQGIVQVCQTILCLCGMSLADVHALDIKLTWQDPLPNDDFAQAQAWQVKVQALGYSQTTAIEETGGNPDTEQERKQDEQQQQVNDFAQGKGLPSGMPMMPGQDEEQPQQQGEEQTAPPSSGGKAGGKKNAPPMNHPAAQRQRAMMQQMAGS